MRLTHWPGLHASSDEMSGILCTNTSDNSVKYSCNRYRGSLVISARSVRRNGGMLHVECSKQCRYGLTNAKKCRYGIPSHAVPLRALLIISVLSKLSRYQTVQIIYSVCLTALFFTYSAYKALRNNNFMKTALFRL